MMHVKRTGSEPLNTFFYLHRDYLGSVLAITDQNAHLVERRQFGAWGTVDKFWNSQGATEFNYYTTLLDRGYTGHEHLFFVSLINMNGRLYDAKLGRFLSPDNFVQDPFSTQSYNRYGYVVNNPLSFSDESGEFILAAVLIGAFVNIFMQGISGNINSIGDFFLAGAIGAASGFLGAGVASLAAGGTFLSGAVATGFMQGAFAGAASGLTAGFVGGAGNAWMNGASFGDGLMAGLKAGVSGMFIGAAVGGITGGIKANKDGLGFWDGSTVKDAAKVNDPINDLLKLNNNDGNLIACSDCDYNFKVGDNLKDFKANFSGKDDYFQAIKAFKKAHIYNGSKMKDLFDFNSMDGWFKNGWTKTGGNIGSIAYKDFFGADGYRFTLSIDPMTYNYSTSRLGISTLGRLGSHIYIEYGYSSMGESTPLAQWIFKSQKSIHDRIIQAMYNYLTK